MLALEIEVDCAVAIICLVDDKIHCAGKWLRGGIPDLVSSRDV